MVLKLINGKDAVALSLENKARKYPSPQGRTAALFPHVRPQTRAGFHINPADRIFAVGSCFARKMEHNLAIRDFHVLSRPVGPLPLNKGSDDSQVMNKYNVLSIVQEIEWALSPCPPPPDHTLIEYEQNWFYDLSIGAFLEGDRSEMTAMRAAYSTCFRQIRNADVIILTLGLAECWYDANSEVFLNATPPRKLIRKYPDRFEFLVLDYPTILDALHRIDTLLRNAFEKPLRILATVSPVPLATTFTDQDAIVANSYSKAVQRAAVEAFVTHSPAEYFPSYEYVAFSDADQAWGKSDYRHVSPDLVETIVTDFLATYAGRDDRDPLTLARQALAEKRPQTALGILSRLPPSTEVTWLKARCYSQKKQFSEAILLYQRVAAKPGVRQAKAKIRSARLTRKLQHATPEHNL